MFAMSAGPSNEPGRVVFRPAPQILAPDWRGRLRSAPAATWVVVILLLVVGTLRDPSLQGWLYTALALVVVFVVPVLLARTNARLVLSRAFVDYRGMLRVRHRCRRQDVARLVRVPIAVLGPRIIFKRLLLVSTGGRALLSIQEDLWSPSDLNRLRDELGVPVTVLDQPQTPSKVNVLFPGAASFGLVHRGAIGLILAALALVVLLGVLGGHAGHS